VGKSNDQSLREEKARLRPMAKERHTDIGMNEGQAPAKKTKDHQ
jgi:hypothetical protein